MILIDLNNLGFAATAANPGLASDGKPTGGVFGAIRSLRKLRQEYGGRMLALHDGRSWRYDAYPEYKGNRSKPDPRMDKTRSDWKAQKPLVVRAMQLMGIDQLRAANMEADDLAARVVAQRAGKETVLVSGDRDWWQLVRPGVTWIDPIKDRRCTPGNFNEMAGFPTSFQFVQTKALAGDAGDNVPPCGGVGPGAAKWIFDNIGSVDALFNTSMEAGSAKWPKKVQDFADSEEKVAAYKRNLLLVWLNHPEAPAAEGSKLVRGRLDPAGFAALAEELDFHSILRDPDAWLAPFADQAISKEST